MKIINKDYWGFWCFKKYFFVLELEDESLIEIYVSQKIWNAFNINDYFDNHHKQFYTF